MGTRQTPVRAAIPAFAAVAAFAAHGALAGCAHVEPVAAWTDGTVALGVAFPGMATVPGVITVPGMATPAARALAAAPAGTTRVEVRVTGVGVPADAVLAATLTPAQARVVFTGVPAGAKRVEARAYDAEDRPIAAGGADLAIVPGATVAARIRLVPTDDGGRFDLVLE